MINMKPEHKNLCKLINGTLFRPMMLSDQMVVMGSGCKAHVFGGWGSLNDAINDEAFSEFILNHTEYNGVRDYLSFRYITRMKGRSSGLIELQKIDDGILNILENVLCDFNGVSVHYDSSRFSDVRGYFVRDSDGVDVLTDFIYEKGTYLHSLIRTVCRRRIRYDEIRVRLSK